MKIAICDDDAKMAAQVEKLLAESFGDKNLFESEVYLSGEDLLKVMEQDKEYYQMYILDIEMGGINGLELAKIIRSNDINAIIIFITSHAELMQEAFEVRAFHYLVKPLDLKKARTTIVKAVDSLKAKKTVFQYGIRKRTYSIYFQDIEYFESYNRKIIIHCHNEILEYYGSLSNVLEKVDQNLFAQVHKSYVVNMDCVKLLEGEKLILNSGTSIAITKKYCKSFNTSYRNFVMMRING